MYVVLKVQNLNGSRLVIVFFYTIGIYLLRQTASGVLFLLFRLYPFEQYSVKIEYYEYQKFFH